MSNRKLQAEIDRVLKKVSEGVETFDEIFQKIYSSSNSNQKEKLEQDLKKEIKKLQRLRDQIKTWLSGNEIKDKRSLTENRKLIESQMEKFKACEREMKTKQYSKEGLQAKEKLDPHEVAKEKSAAWITASVDTLSTQVDMLEAESEQINATKGRKLTKGDQERLKEIEKFLIRHKMYMVKLETMLRMLENGGLTSEDVDSVKDGIDYYVESALEDDFLEDEEIFDHLDLVEEELTPSYVDELDGDSAESLNKESEITKKKIPDAVVGPSVVSTSVSPIAAPPTTSASTTPVAVVQSIEYPKVSSKTTPVTSLPKSPIPNINPVQNPATSVNISLGSSTVSTVVNPVPIASSSKITPLPPVQPAQPSQPNLSQKFSPAVATISSTPRIERSENLQKPPTVEHQKPKTVSRSGFPESFSDLVTSYNAAKSKIFGNGDEIIRNQHLLTILETGLHFCPGLVDTQRTRVYTSQNPVSGQPFYPAFPSLEFDVPSFYEKLDIDTLFFIFYYQQGSKQQYLAARELKRQSWRFHKKYQTWFQRHEEPKQITEEFEQGTYIYFDYEGAWCQRKKTEFTFEYRYLEDEQ